MSSTSKRERFQVRTCGDARSLPGNGGKGRASLLWSRVAALSVAALAALASVSASAQIEDLTINLSSFSAGDTASADAVLTVVDSRAKPVLNLAADDFSVSLNGEPVVVSSLERGVDSTQPISILLALDVSGSMEGEALNEAKAAAISFIGSLEPQDSVAVMTFANSVDLVLPFTTDRAVASAAIDGLAASGETALYQATEDSLRLAADQGTSYRAVILLSDGLDNGSLLSREEALAAAGALGVPVFSIGLGNDIDRLYLQSLANESGGTFAETPSPEGLAQLYQEAGEILRGQYIVSLDTSKADFALTEPATLRIEVAQGDRIAQAERAVCAQELCVALGPLAEQLDSTTTVTANVISSESVSSVTFEVDGQAVETLVEPPYEFTLDPESLDDGDRALSATVTTETGRSLSSQATVRIGASGGGGINLMLVGGGVVLFLVVGGALYLFFRRRSGGALRKLDPNNLRPPERTGGGTEIELDDQIWPDEPAPLAAAPVEAMGHLYITGGNMSGDAFPVGGSPVSVGSGGHCQIRLTYEVGNEEQVPIEYMRVWVRDGELMVHEIRRMTAMGAEGGRWAKLESGDTLPLGPYTVRFELGEKAEAEDAVPNILRDPAVVNEELEASTQQLEPEPEQSPDPEMAALPPHQATVEDGPAESASQNGVPSGPKLDEGPPAAEQPPTLQPQPED